MDAPQRVSLTALRRERERRQRADREVEELRSELERFDAAKFGYAAETATEEMQRLANEMQQAEADQATLDPAVAIYNRSYAAFVKSHGREAEAKVDAATQRMTRDQQQHVLGLVKSHRDPVAAIHAYADQLGLLDFKGQPIEDVLASKAKQPEGQLDSSQVAQHYEQLNRYAQEVNATEKRANFLASKADFVSEYGKAAYNELDRLSIELTRSGHPAAAHYVEAVTTSSEPVAMAAQILSQLGLWQPQNPRQTPQPQQVMPSNFASARSVNGRSGPAFAGPTPLNDIFKR